jgi:phage terminase large subunit
MKLISPDYFRGAITRYTQSSLKKSIYQDILDIAEQLGITSYLDISGDTISCKHNRNKIITHSMKLSEGTMTGKGKGLSGITHLLIDEAQEVKSEEEYIKLVDSIRTPGVERKIFLLFNPEAKAHWLHKRFFIDGNPNPMWEQDHCFIHTTYKDNPFFDSKKAEEWDRMASLKPDWYKYHIMGNWKDYVEGRIYDNWEFIDSKPERFENFVYGMDFGFNHPTTLVKVYYTEDELFIEPLIYARGKQNHELIDMMKHLDVSQKHEIMCDYARPEIIAELKSAGYFAMNAEKTVKLGIDTVRSFNVLVLNNKDLQTEYENYQWKIVGGLPVDEPSKTYDDAMDAIRYATMRIKSVYINYQPLISF